MAQKLLYNTINVVFVGSIHNVLLCYTIIILTPVEMFLVEKHCC